MFRKALAATNASKFVVLLLVNWLDDLGEAFNLYDLSDAQEKVLNGGATGVLLVYFLATYKLSHKRKGTVA